MYISQPLRDRLDPYIESLMAEAVAIQLDDETVIYEDLLAYMLMKTLKASYGETVIGSHITDALGTLSRVQNEFMRKIVIPQAVQQEFENGTIDTFSDRVDVLEDVVVELPTEE